ncbi:uncharacterized protein [Nicotiana sylvestris]|uniref:uncharacterized protein n=1 Tax=Nicotiana sylvestris TaxID=4096 RepID=UPI00388C3562
MDSDCSKYMTGSKNHFLSLEDLKGGNVSFGNRKKCEIIRVGKVGKTDSHSIENVFLIDELKYSLISVSQLYDRGNMVGFTSTKYFVINLTTDKIVLQGKRVNNIYVVNLSTLSDNEFTCLSVLNNDPFLCHKRLGHASLRQLNKLISKNLVIGLPNIKFKEDKVCEACSRRKQHGINHKCSAPRTPKQNGVVERKNMTLEEMARTMLLSSKLPHSFWAEAVNTAFYIINRCMTRCIIETTPYELLKGRKPNISHLRAVGCKCFMHYNGKDSLGKFDPRSDEGVFLGYSSHSKAYNIYNKGTTCIEESVHVVFELAFFLRGKNRMMKQFNCSHPIEKIIIDPTSGIKTRSSLKNLCVFDAFLSLIEPKNIVEALQDADWVNAMQDELNQFERSQVWHLVPRPKDRSIYVDDIIFGATTNKLSKEFAKLMGSEFEISMMATVTKLDIDEPSSSIDQKLYRGMIVSLLYLTASRPDIVFNVGFCARFQTNPNESHLTTVKRIFRYLKGTTNLCLWFLVDKKRTSAVTHFLGSCLVSWAAKKKTFVALSTAEAEYVATASCCA